MSETFITLSQGPKVERSFGKGSGFLEDFMLSPMEQLVRWKEMAHNNYNIYLEKKKKRRPKKEPSINITQPFQEYYSNYYKEIQFKFDQCHSSRPLQLVNEFWNKNISPRKMQSTSTTRRDLSITNVTTPTTAAKFQRIKSLDVKNYCIIKGKTYYLKNTLAETLSNFRKKQKEYVQSRPQTQLKPRYQSIDQGRRRAQQQTIKVEKQKDIKNIGDKRSQSIIQQCDNVLKQKNNYKIYDLDNKDVKALFSISHDPDHHHHHHHCSIEFKPELAVKEKFRNNLFNKVIYRQSLRIYNNRKKQDVDTSQID